jgi:hypothetical protein
MEGEILDGIFVLQFPIFKEVVVKQ